jgi:ATP-dependent Lon protease
MDGDGELQITGQLGDVMKESARAAMSFVRAHLHELAPDLPTDWFKHHDVHIHVPAGAIPKDGPSAGITMTTALVSLLTGRHVRDDIAMTGEMTLTGQVLPIGGLKDKALAAQRNGISKIVAPELNEPDTEEIPEHLRSKLEFHFVAQIDDVLACALEPIPEPASPTPRVRTAAGRNGDRVYARAKPESKRNASDQR